MLTRKSSYYKQSELDLFPIIAACIIIAGFIFIVVWMSTSSTAECDVIDSYWTHTTRVERYQVVTREGFDIQPGSFNVIPLGLRYHHTETEPYYDVFDGKMKLRNKSVDMPFYRWNIWDWNFNRDVSETGRDLYETWFPNPEKVSLNKNIGQGELERAYNLTAYTFICKVNDKEGKAYFMKASSLDDLKLIKEKKHHKIEIPHVGDDVKLK